MLGFPDCVIYSNVLSRMSDQYMIRKWNALNAYYNCTQSITKDNDMLHNFELFAMDFLILYTPY